MLYGAWPTIQRKLPGICKVRSLLNALFIKKSNLSTDDICSIKSIIELITSHPKLTVVAEEISSLFLQRFDPSRPLDDAIFEAKCKDLVSKIQVLQFDTARVALLKILNGNSSCILAMA